MAHGQPARPDRGERRESVGAAGGTDREALDDAPAAAEAPVGSSAGEGGLKQLVPAAYRGAHMDVSVAEELTYARLVTRRLSLDDTPGVGRDSDVAGVGILWHLRRGGTWKESTCWCC